MTCPHPNLDAKCSDPPARGRPRKFDRAQAVNTAMELFWKQGYVQTTMDDLCAAMAIKSASLYCAFGSKSELFIETLEHYRRTYWIEPLKRFLAEPDLYVAVKNLLEDSTRIYLRPGASCGCFGTVSTMTLPPDETRVVEAVYNLEQEVKKVFRQRLMMAVNAKQIAPECNIPAIASSLVTFIKGLSLIARGDICQAELKEIALRGLLLLPPIQTVTQTSL